MDAADAFARRDGKPLEEVTEERSQVRRLERNTRVYLDVAIGVSTHRCWRAVHSSLFC